VTHTAELSPATARKIFVWQMVFLTVLATLSTISNTYTVVADRARSGRPLPFIAPLIWESSSHIVMLMLVPALAWWLAKFPITRESWWRSLPAHLLATAPFSLLHTQGMVLLRELAYRSAGMRYDFGPFWSNWVYEYRKDFLTYWMLIGTLLAFRVYGLWLDSRERKVAEQPPPDAPEKNAPLERLVVHKRNREFILETGAIDRLAADGNYVLVYAAGESYRLRDSLEGLAQRLGEARFVRVHRTHVVNIDRIREIQPWDHGDYRIVLKDGSFVNFSRRYRTRLSHLFP
jgi:hypothetical protein